VNYNSGFQSAWKPRGVGTDARSKKMRLLFLLLSALLAGCMLVPHKIDIQQGNYVDQAMVAKLKAEMTRSQVRFILGTPLIADIFHQNRWDYVYLTGKANDVHARHKITVIFDGDKLKHVEGDIVPADMLSQAVPDTRKP
jgi:outer membrane protein assembly factor BamE